MKKILVTGALGGMGSAICKLLSAKGYKVFGLDYRIPDSENNDKNIEYYVCNVRDKNNIKEVFEKIKSKAKYLDGIIHTAGVYDLDSLIEMDEERFLRVFDINLFGVYRINKAFVPMVKRGGKIIITTSELAPLDPLPFTGVYAISKAALEKYAYSLRMEVNLLDISVSVIRPGAVNTGLISDSTSALDKFCENTKMYKCNAERFKAIVDSIEARSVLPEKVANIALQALSSKHPKYVYKLNRNPLLLMLNSLPKHAQVFAIKQVLKPNSNSKKRQK